MKSFIPQRKHSDLLRRCNLVLPNLRVRNPPRLPRSYLESQSPPINYAFYYPLRRSTRLVYRTRSPSRDNYPPGHIAHSGPSTAVRPPLVGAGSASLHRLYLLRLFQIFPWKRGLTKRSVFVKKDLFDMKGNYLNTIGLARYMLFCKC